MQIDVPDGDVADRLTILELKLRHLHDPAKRAHVQRAHAELAEAWRSQCSVPYESLPGLDRLRAVNAALWEVEDALRAHEREERFDASFVERARSVYVLNDERARLKAAISEATGSALREQKSYV